MSTFGAMHVRKRDDRWYLRPLMVLAVFLTHGRGSRPTDSGTLADACSVTDGP